MINNKYDLEKYINYSFVKKKYILTNYMASNNSTNAEYANNFSRKLFDIVQNFKNVEMDIPKKIGEIFKALHGNDVASGADFNIKEFVLQK
jgi:hypothetical protein